MEVVLLLGGNVGDPRATVLLAERLINERVGKVLSRSRDHWTEPWGFTDDRLFLNRALLVNTDLNERAVLDTCLGIEMELGRVRNMVSGYTSRTIDIDLLFAEGRTVDEIDLVVPHPRIQDRLFALSPAADIVPELVHPRLHRTVLQLLNDAKQRD
ncbi:MAG: 2-amino-4-hydroxy-6-hydroxymethyldihydropteridine diphosphokinase [Flavobacteriales bacterium]|nr:2-amino-4-hydroxy-6-hydroxymethyldihydropteridine diphosphokinase [Flavobacteriales bacterium]